MMMNNLSDFLHVCEKAIFAAAGREMNPRENDNALALFKRIEKQAETRSVWLTDAELLAEITRSEQYAKKVEFERLRKYAPASILEATAKNVTKSATAQRRSSMFDDIINQGRGSKVEKSADVAEFMWKDGVLQRVDPMLTQPGGNPKPEDATRSGEPASARFSMDASIVDRPANENAPMPLADYDYVEPDANSAGTLTPNFLNVGPDGGVKEPAMYSPAQPGRMPTDPGADPENLDGDKSGTGTMQGSAKQGTRLGNSYLLKSEF